MRLTAHGGERSTVVSALQEAEDGLLCLLQFHTGLMVALVWLWTTAGVSLLVYLLVGGLLQGRRHLRPISSRSPWMLLISHWANFLELCLFYQVLWDYQTDQSWFPAFYTAAAVLFHYLLYFPYLLRCYRLKFVFTLDREWTVENDYFRSHIERSRQSWLVCILLTMMLPVVAVAIVVITVPGYIEIAPATDNTDTALRTNIAYIALCFIEEVLFVVAVFQLRHIEDHFRMTRELTLVCLLWLCNSVVSRYWADTWWLYESIARNWALMLISSVWPVYKSFRGFGFSEAITSEVANSLELLLQNQFTLDYFEKFLLKGDFSRERRDSGVPSSSAAPDHMGERLLDFWLQCEIYRNSPDISQAKQLYSQYIDPDSDTNIDLPLPLVRDIKAGIESLPDGTLFLNSQEFAFTTLRDYYFALFQRSVEYSKMMREITRQEIYLNRLVLTSLHGKLLYK